MIDLSTLDTAAACDKGAEIELKHPVTGEGLKQYISIVGKDGRKFQELTIRRANEDRRAAFAAQRKGKPPELESYESAKAKATELLVACTTGFRDIFVEGVNVVFSAETATKLYDKFPWIREQVDEAIVDLENFTKG